MQDMQARDTIKGTKETKKKETKKSVKQDVKQNVIWLGLTSLFTDVSTEMLTPILPLFLSNVLGASGIVIGFIEGLAKGSEHILSIFAGWLSDRMGRRKPLAVFGYFIATVTKGTYAFVTGWEQLFIARLIDRSGKAIRNPPRDALLAESISKKAQRSGFAIHRVLDTIGAILGPLTTLAFLIVIGVSIDAIGKEKELLSYVARNIFLLSLIPGFLAVIIIAFAVREAKVRHVVKKKGERLIDLLRDMLSVAKYGNAYNVFLITSILFYFAMPTMAFFYLKGSAIGIHIDNILILASFFNITYIIGAAIFGFTTQRSLTSAADSLDGTIGRVVPKAIYRAMTKTMMSSKNVIALTLAFSAIIFFAFSFVQSIEMFAILFGAFGFVFGILEVETRVYISSTVNERILGGAFGTWRTLTGISMIVSGILLGILWDISPSLLFMIAAIIAFIALFYFIFATNNKTNRH